MRFINFPAYRRICSIYIVISIFAADCAVPFNALLDSVVTTAMAEDMIKDENGEINDQKQ
jgi:hypothetical protein